MRNPEWISGASETPPKRIRVLVVDRHRMFVEALELLFAAERDLQMAGAAATAQQAIELIGRLDPDVVLMDIDTPGTDGVEATRGIHEMSGSPPVVVMSSLPKPAALAAALEAGACGFVSKTWAADDMIDVIRRAAEGEVMLPHGGVRTLVGRLRAAAGPLSDEGVLLSQLTGREVQILRAIARGYSTREVAEALGISRLTAESHVRNILAKLGVHSKLQAATLALRYGVIQNPR
jgi:DNA-binding NarL/FixJ family response regulator